MYNLQGERLANFLNVSVFLAAILVVTTVQHESAKINRQPQLNTYSIVGTNASDDDGKTLLPSQRSTPSSVATNEFVKQFVLQIQNLVSKQRKENKGENDQTRDAAFFYPFDMDADAEWLKMSGDKGRQDGSDNRQETGRQPSYRDARNKIKATDYIVITPKSPSVQKSTNNNGSKESSILESAIDYWERKLKRPFATKYTISKNMPAVNFEVNSENGMFIFEVDEKEKSSYFISVVVEKMNCRSDNNGRNDEVITPKLIVQGEENELSICKNVNNSANNYQSVDYLTDGDKFVRILTSGSWSNTSAMLVASVYTQASHCSYCPDDHFCCGRKETACLMATGKYKNWETLGFNNTAQQLYRCIPKQDMSGESLICNGHPNCGFHCNVDEQSSSCPNAKNDDENIKCTGYDCRDYQEQDRFLITLLLLVIFCVFVPFIIFLFLCSRKEIHRELTRQGRCPVPLEILFCPFSISADDPNSTSVPAEATSTAARRHERGSAQQSRTGDNTRRAVAPSSTEASPGLENPGFFDDLPPSYLECCNNKVSFPNPSPGGIHQTESREIAVTLTDPQRVSVV